MTKEEDRGEAIWINAKEMLTAPGSMLVHGLAMTLVMSVWARDKEAFRFDPKALAERLRRGAKRDEDVEGALRANESELRVFFVVLPDGRWAPSPQYFVLNDPYAEGAPS